MTAKEWLSRYKTLGQDIAAQKERLAQLAASAASTTAKNNGGMPGGSGVSRKIERAVVAAAEIQAQIQKLERERQAIEQAIISLNDPQSRAVLTYLYICGLPIDQTAQRMGYCGKQVSRIRDEALSHIEPPKDE